MGVAILLIVAATASAEDPVDFPDENLKAAVEQALDVSDPTPSDMLALSSLHAVNRGIADLTGLEYAKNLYSLCLRGNQISDISPLSGLTNLTGLNLDINHISDISPLSGLTNLVNLSLNINQISDISPLLGLTTLVLLNLDNNQISEIPVLSGLPNLTRLSLRQNQISDISRLSVLTSLKGLHLSSNQVSDISALSGLTNLLYLFLSTNQISDISALSGLTNLIYLGLYSNHISDISSLSGLTNIFDLNLRMNQISEISPLSGLTNIRYLYLNCNPLDWKAHCFYIPMIAENNPGIYLTCDPNPYVCSLSVEIDIKPGSYPNTINLGSFGLVPVAILSSDGFDATTVDPDTVALAGAGVAVRGKGSKLMSHEEDVNGDDLVDLVVQVATENLDPDSFQDGYAILTASTYDGQAIKGQDEIRIVPPE